MKALVTGGTGFVGSAVVRALLEAGHTVRALVRPTSDRRNLDGLAVDAAVGDLADVASLHGACTGCDALFHVAADYRLWTRDPQAMMASNVDGTRNIVRAAMEAGVSRIVYTSSVATLGIRPDGRPADEQTPATIDGMIGLYKRSKFMAEEIVLEMVATEGAPVVIVNPAAPIGPRDIKPTPTGRMIVEAAAGRMPAYVDTGLNVVHVDDVAVGHVAAFERGGIGERYILGGENLTLRQILVAIAEMTGGRPPLFRVPHSVILPVAFVAEAWTRWTGGDEPFATVDGVRMARKKMFFTCDKAVRQLGYAPRPAIEALADAVRWFRGNGYLG
jgi:dihydroflavonol-4-reductase